MKHRRMRWSTWVRDFRPLKTPYSDPDVDATMFETYRPDLDFVRAQPQKNVWTVLDCDGKLIVADGYHLVNRLGYYVTEVACPENEFIDVI